MGVGEVHGHSRGGSGDVPHQARAGMASNHEECHGHLRGGSGHQALQARALHGDPGECLHDRAPQSSHGVCHANRATPDEPQQPALRTLNSAAPRPGNSTTSTTICPQEGIGNTASERKLEDVLTVGSSILKPSHLRWT